MRFIKKIILHNNNIKTINEGVDRIPVDSTDNLKS